MNPEDYQPRHGAGVNDTTRRHEPRHAEPSCPRCIDGAPGVVCRPCAGELAAQLADPGDELVSVFYTGHSVALSNYPADIRGIA